MIRVFAGMMRMTKQTFVHTFGEKWRKVVWFDQYIFEVCMVARKVDNIASWHKPKTVKTCWNSRIYSSHNKTAIHPSIHPSIILQTHSTHTTQTHRKHTHIVPLSLSLTLSFAMYLSIQNWTSSILAAVVV